MDQRRFHRHLIPERTFQRILADREPETFLRLFGKSSGNAARAAPDPARCRLRSPCGLFVRLARGASRDKSCFPGSRQRVLAPVREMDRDFWHEQDVDSCARRAGLSRRRFKGLFREVAGESWLQRLTCLRIDRAKQLLQRTGLFITTVVFESGFKDAVHFHRTFRAVTGQTPASFRTRDSRS